MARRSLHSSWNSVSRAMHARNISTHITNLLSWVEVTPSIQAAAEQAGEEAVRYFRCLERQPPIPSATQKAEAAKALAIAEAAFTKLKETLEGAQPSEKARILGTAWA
ncbi:hypothetical protein DC522_28445 [Microvirga sp. KLBC 81]|nr:hypothetical protein DC522_28445 [Microvirga sp. KLBC 81]